MGTFQDKHGVFHNERRRHPHLRAIFDDARGRIDHFFHATNEWANSPMDYLAHRVVHEAYPKLTTHDVKTLVAAIERTFQPQ
ncbi:MAG: hypothetical protein MUE86_08390 [Thiobacillaceae bacterium]|jgi:hypothetical protein|nr:MAG: hypothetical protein FD142_896 [bacterium]KAF0150049.1 MAG: hypothetical protein FD187_639 [bacterium]KAF0169157.1 MAG: hypothetical protein FD158_709 [bacterium]MCU0934425.1 hypothetical protein [Thiobacillaceae bacterium]TXT16207.1 MAG: hypothetical protein FD132_2936 [bacterium]